MNYIWYAVVVVSIVPQLKSMFIIPELPLHDSAYVFRQLYKAETQDPKSPRNIRIKYLQALDKDLDLLLQPGNEDELLAYAPTELPAAQQEDELLAYAPTELPAAQQFVCDERTAIQQTLRILKNSD